LQRIAVPSARGGEGGNYELAVAVKVHGFFAPRPKSCIESLVKSPEVAMAKVQMRSNREKKKPKQDKNKGKGTEDSQVKLGTSYKSQYGKKH
jgi:hypothetical protein